MVVAALATTSPFMKKVTATAKFPWWVNLRKPFFLQDYASNPISWNPRRCNTILPLPISVRVLKPVHPKHHAL